MKKFGMILLLLVISPVVFADDSCVPMGPTTDCINVVLPSTNYHADQAARACAGGVSIECINVVLPAANYNASKAAEACKGGVTTECINLVLPSVNYNAIAAANACGGR